MAQVDQVRELVEPLLHARRLDLYDVEFLGRGPTTVLRVFVDREGGVDTDTLATVNRAISRALDEADMMPGRYTLEVSSPGLERALRRPAHFRAVTGRDVRVKTSEGSVYQGILVEAGDEAISIDVNGDLTTVAYDDVKSARTVFEWGPAPKAANGKVAKGARR